jgi:predicted Rossmann fold flavoprotein
MKYDVIVIGGGPSGLMAAASAAKENAKVLLLDKGDSLGRKLAISGGGRCNVTNAGDLDYIVRNIPGNGRFLYSAFSIFNNVDIIRFFENLGIALKEEDRGRMFPVSNKAKDVVSALVQHIKEIGVHIMVNQPVSEVLYQDGHVEGVHLKPGKIIESSTVVVAVGGKSVPHTGSTGDGYAWAERAGHTITDLFPTEVPITSAEPFIKDRSLQGLSLRDIDLSVLDPKKPQKKLIEHHGDMIFTHFGISGPVALRCSQFVVKALKKYNVNEISMQIDLFPDKSEEEIVGEIRHRAENEPKRALKNVLKGFLPERLLPLVMERASIDPETTFHHLSFEKTQTMANILKKFTFLVNGTLSIEDAFVTGGGVNLKEIDPKTLQSKKMPGLFFSGEILDIHGYTGGFNITAAFATGFVAGKSAAEISHSLLTVG